MIYNLLFPTGDYMPRPEYADFRDIARAHVGALNTKPDRKNRKRVLVVSPHNIKLKHVMEIIKKEHPELERRFTTKPEPKFPYDAIDIDYERIKEVTGMRKEDFHTLEEVCLYLTCLIMHERDVLIF